MEPIFEKGGMEQDGERRKRWTYSAAVIGAIMRKSRVYVGHSMVRKTDARRGHCTLLTRIVNRACDRRVEEIM